MRCKVNEQATERTTKTTKGWACAHVYERKEHVCSKAKASAREQIVHSFLFFSLLTNFVRVHLHLVLTWMNSPQIVHDHVDCLNIQPTHPHIVLNDRLRRRQRSSDVSIEISFENRL